jgi:hypothetical protein
MSGPANLSAVSSGLFPCLLKPAQMENGKDPVTIVYAIQMEHRITEKIIYVDIDSRMPAGYQSVSPWPAILQSYLDPLMYPSIGRRENIRPKSVMLREYTEQCYEDNIAPRFVIDKYIRIGNTYICSRCYGRSQTSKWLTIEMRLNDELKQEIVAGAMRPKRLKFWLEQGWEDEWYAYFSR